MPASSSSTSTQHSLSREVANSAIHEPDVTPPLTRELLLGYEYSHHRLLLWLGLLMTCFLAIFPVNDPDIFFSLQIGKLISDGQFSFGKDPFSYADGEQAIWTHNGWLGDLLIYQVYQLGSGPLLVIFRSVLITLLFWMMMQLAGARPKFWTVVAIVLGFLALGQRMYLRTELFSVFLLGLTLWTLHHQPKPDCWLRRLHTLTAGRLYWLLPVIFLLWANLDGWFFLGLIVIALWTLSTWMQRTQAKEPQFKSLLFISLICFVACLATPFHVKSYLEIPHRLLPATGSELQARFEEMKKTNPELKMSEQYRFFASPITPEFFNNTRVGQIATLQSQAPLLGIFYPMGLSISEWAFYPLLIVILASFISGVGSAGPGRILLLILFISLGAWQNRFVGFFVAIGVGLAVLNFQSKPRETPLLTRFAILGNQLLCLLLGLLIQFCTLLHLVPSNDFSTTALGTSSLGYVHPRGTFGFAFRSDPYIEQACHTLNDWRVKNLIAGKTFHFDWTDVVGYDVWYNPGARHFFDRRYEVHDESTARDFLVASDAILSVLRDNNSAANAHEQQARWQEVFKKHDISHLVIKRRSVIRFEREQNRELEVVRLLLLERDKNNLPVWRPLQLHNGQVYALAWAGSPHWGSMQKLEYNPNSVAFRTNRENNKFAVGTDETMNFTRFLAGDPPRRPASLDEASWHLYHTVSDSDTGVARIYASYDMQIRNVFGQLQARLATPISTMPFFPVWFSTRQSSSAAILLSLDAIRRAVREITPETTPYQKAEIWLQYLETITRLSDYEQSFLPMQSRYREPLHDFVLRQAAYAAVEANHPSAWLINLELAKQYVNKGLLDAALEHTQMAIGQLNKQKNEQIEKLLKNFDSLCKQQYGFAPTELENQVKQQTERWKAGVLQLPKSNDPARDVATRANLALQAGLPRLAIEEILASNMKSDDIALLATSIYSVLGQHDLVLTEFFYRSPKLREKLGETNFLNVAALGEWCLGRPERAAEYREKLAQQMDKSSLQLGLDYSLTSIFGTSTQPAGNVVQPIFFSEQTALESLRLADQQISAGLLYLEGGKPKQAAAIFEKVLHDVEPNTPWRLLLERYYLQITGEVLKP